MDIIQDGYLTIELSYKINILHDEHLIEDEYLKRWISCRMNILQDEYLTR